jgi:cytochrome P450
MAVKTWHDLAPVPEHVPAHLVFDFDFRLDPELQTDPHERYVKLLQEAPPIFYTPRNSGHWTITGYDLVFAAARATEVFSSRPVAVNGELPPLLLPLMVDPPVHNTYRGPLNHAFNPRGIQLLEDEIRSLARELIGKVADAGECDFVSSVAEPLPVIIFLRMMGLPIDRLREFRTAVKASNELHAPEEGLSTIVNIAGIMEEFIVARRDKPESDLISRLWSLEIEGRPITIEEVRNYCILLFLAGLDTVINAMAFAIRHLAGDRDLQAKLRADPAQIPSAVEEMLRRYGIVAPPRQVVQDYELGGVSFRKGDSVLLLLPAANFDPSVFPSPACYQMDRDNKYHMTFNRGAHHCVGAHLARLELKVIYEEWLRAIPEFRLAPDRPAQFQIGNIVTVRELPIAWN